MDPVDQTSVLPDPPASDQRGLREWMKWKKDQSPERLGILMGAFKDVIQDVPRANPKLNPHLMRAKARPLALEAFKTYDPAVGASLATHVRNHLKPLVLRAHNETRAIPKGRFVEEAARDYKRVFDEFRELNDREPTAGEMAQEMKISRDRSAELMRRIRSYEIPESQFAGDVLPEEDDPATRRLRIWTNYVYDGLSPRDQLIMDYRTGRNGREKLGLEEIAAKLGISTSMVHKISTDIANRILEGMEPANPALASKEPVD